MHLSSTQFNKTLIQTNLGLAMDLHELIRISQIFFPSFLFYLKSQKLVNLRGVIVYWFNFMSKFVLLGDKCRSRESSKSRLIYFIKFCVWMHGLRNWICEVVKLTQKCCSTLVAAYPKVVALVVLFMSHILGTEWNAYFPIWGS